MICAYCNKDDPEIQDDHVFEKSLNKGAPHLYAPACGKCNNEHFNESLLKDFLVVANPQLAEERIVYWKEGHYINKVLSRFVEHIDGNFYLFPDFKLVMTFKKWILGVRYNHMKDKWSYLDHNEVRIFTIHNKNYGWEVVSQPDRNDVSKVSPSFINEAQFVQCGNFRYCVIEIEEGLGIMVRYRPDLALTNDILVVGVCPGIFN